MKLVREIYAQARQYAPCRMFRGDESLEQIVRLFLSPQGVEFCQANNFPPPEMLRRFKPYGVERFGVFIDAGKVELRNAAKAVLVGSTEATMEYDRLGRYELIMMHGARVKVNASGWAVVFVTSRGGCRVETTASGGALVL